MEKRKLLAQVLDMEEIEMRAALIEIVNGVPVDRAIEQAYNYIRREARKLRRSERTEWEGKK
jgi:hypothetical protein